MPEYKALGRWHFLTKLERENGFSAGSLELLNAVEPVLSISAGVADQLEFLDGTRRAELFRHSLPIVPRGTVILIERLTICR